jgi:hypothetical protein
MSDMVRTLDDVVISIEPGDHQFPVAPMVANYISQLQRENTKYRDLAEEVWGVLVDASLGDKESASAAFRRVDRRLREAGLKRFPKSPPAKDCCQSHPNDN